jgi:hypothetical protein
VELGLDFVDWSGNTLPTKPNRAGRLQIQNSRHFARKMRTFLDNLLYAAKYKFAT